MIPPQPHRHVVEKYREHGSFDHGRTRRRLGFFLSESPRALAKADAHAASTNLCAPGRGLSVTIGIPKWPPPSQTNCDPLQ